MPCVKVPYFAQTKGLKRSQFNASSSRVQKLKVYENDKKVAVKSVAKIGGEEEM